MAPRELPRVDANTLPGDSGFDTYFKEKGPEDPNIKLGRKAAYTDPYGDANRKRLDDFISTMQSRTAPTMTAHVLPGVTAVNAKIDQTQANAARQLAMQTRGQQNDLASYLRTQAMGQGGPSAAMAQLNAGTDRAMSSALSIARGQRGGNQSAALRQALMAQGDTMQRASNDASMLRAQEQQMAQQGLAGVLGQLQQGDSNMRATDLNAATAQAGFDHQTNLANAQNRLQTNLANQNALNDASRTNLGAQMQQTQMNDQQAMAALMQRLGLDQSQWNANMAYQQNRDNRNLQTEAIARGVSMQNQQQGTQAGMAGLSALASLLPALMAASDERAKTDIVDGKKDLHAFLDTVGTHKYRYKDPGKPLRGEGEFVSPMAQELEQTKLGKNLVKEAPDGTKIVDYGKGLGLFLSALSDQHRRLAKLEVKRG